MSFEFATSGRIIFGAGVVHQIAELAAGFGHRPLLVTGRSAERGRAIGSRLEERDLKVAHVISRGEPSVPDVDQGVARAEESHCDVVVAVGGGSSLDLGKAVAALLANGGSVLDYAEVIGKGRKLEKPSVPVIAVPTTAGTGSEVTRNAVVHSPAHGVKVSLRAAGMLPRIALVDPGLTLSTPRSVTASCGLDALTQLIEPFVSPRANLLTDGICRAGINAAARSLKQACENAGDLTARTNMAFASLCGGLALANAGLGAVHGLAAPLGGSLAAAHGALCARLLPFVMAANVSAMRRREPQNPALGRYDELARLFTGDAQARADDGVAWVRDLCAALEVPGLVELGLHPAQHSALAATSEKSSSMQANPIRLTRQELVAILAAAA